MDIIPQSSRRAKAERRDGGIHRCFISSVAQDEVQSPRGQRVEKRDVEWPVGGSVVNVPLPATSGVRVRW